MPYWNQVLSVRHWVYRDVLTWWPQTSNYWWNRSQDVISISSATSPMTRITVTNCNPISCNSYYIMVYGAIISAWVRIRWISVCFTPGILPNRDWWSWHITKSFSTRLSCSVMRWYRCCLILPTMVLGDILKTLLPMCWIGQRPRVNSINDTCFRSWWVSQNLSMRFLHWRRVISVGWWHSSCGNRQLWR